MNGSDFEGYRHDIVHEQSFKVELEKCCLEFLLNSDLHVVFEGLMDVFRQNSKHKSCSSMILLGTHEISASLVQ